MAADIRNTDEVLDSRDIIARIEELTDTDTILDEDEQEELDALQAFADEAEGYAPDWEYGATLIHADHFTDYCKELLADIGDIPSELPDYIVIDWDATAERLKVDYTEVDFAGEAYLVR